MSQSISGTWKYYPVKKRMMARLNPAVYEEVREE
jgi:hypothetical protein